MLWACVYARVYMCVHMYVCVCLCVNHNSWSHTKWFILCCVHYHNIYPYIKVEVHIFCILQETTTSSMSLYYHMYVMMCSLFSTLMLHACFEVTFFWCVQYLSPRTGRLIFSLSLIFGSQYSTNEGSNEGSSLRENGIHVLKSNTQYTLQVANM